MGKKKILLINIKGTYTQEVNDDIAKSIKESIDNFGMLVYDDKIEIREVEVDGVYWENKDGSL